jgi:hypothetical protein
MLILFAVFFFISPYAGIFLDNDLNKALLY